jgi:Ser/Thr protein kinase RdoA (MazF antagonist)
MVFSAGSIENFVANYYGMVVKASALNGYDELNFLLTDNLGKKNILKLSNSQQDFFFLDAQIKILQHLSKSELALQLQQYTLNKKGQPLTEISIEDKTYYIRILSYLEGTFWVEAPIKSDALHFNLGTFLGKMDKNLSDFKHAGMHRHYTWDISTARDASYKLNCIKDHEKRRMVDYFILQFETEILPTLSSFRHSYTHNDAKDYNVLVNENDIVGLIDFIAPTEIEPLSISQYVQSILRIPSPLIYQPLPLQTGQSFLLYFCDTSCTCLALIMPPARVTGAVVDP